MSTNLLYEFAVTAANGGEGLSAGLFRRKPRLVHLCNQWIIFKDFTMYAAQLNVYLEQRVMFRARRRVRRTTPARFESASQ